VIRTFDHDHLHAIEHIYVTGFIDPMTGDGGRSAAAGWPPRPPSTRSCTAPATCVHVERVPEAGNEGAEVAPKPSDVAADIEVKRNKAGTAVKKPSMSP
jgi:hypothetical protein